MTLIRTNQPARAVGSAIVNKIGTRFLVLLAELRARKEIAKALGKLSPQELRDIGLIQNDVESACSNRLSKGASAELLRTARLRSGNW